VDVGDHDDAVFYLDVREVAGTSPQLILQTSPNKDESNFQTLGAVINVVTGTQIIRILAKYSVPPIARYVRWQFSTQPARTLHDITFRLWAAVT
jgi:hypothetical protein